MKLTELCVGLTIKKSTGSFDKEISAVCCHTKQVVQGAVFVCIDGAKFDAHQLIPQMLSEGVSAIVVEKEVKEYITQDVTIIQVEDTRKALAILAAQFYDHPAQKLKMIGVTGTKGKTTTIYMIRDILELAGIKTALIGTIETIIGKRHIPSENTTPESLTLHQFLSEAVNEGCECVVMEVSSQGLKLGRVDGIIFDYAVFLNLSVDHIGGNEHKDFNEYLQCKKKLFGQCRIGIFNVDDVYAADMMEGNSCFVETFGIQHTAKHQALNPTLFHDEARLGSIFDVYGWYDCHVVLGVPGSFNVYNALAAIAVISHFSVKSDIIRFALANFKVTGRVEIIPIDTEYTMIIDYAHNSISLQSVLLTLREYHPQRIICLFGCGGNRSKVRRFEMGKVAAEYADYIVVTNDNPRDEDPQDIIADILQGIGDTDTEYVIVPDRKEAIRHCMSIAQAGDIVVLAGKGHETYQEIKGVKHDCDERNLIEELCEEEDIRFKK